MIERNADLLRRVADRIERDPDMHDQANWFCPTECGIVACIGGHALIEAGEYIVGDNAWFDFSAVARTLLGFTDLEASYLFSARWAPAEGMTVPDALRRIADGWPVYAVTVEARRFDHLDLRTEFDEWVKAHA